MKFNKILFPVDLSGSSQKFVPYVKSMAEKYDSSLYILYVAPFSHYYTGAYAPNPSIDVFENELIEEARKNLQEFAEKYFEASDNVKVSIVRGDVAEEIINYINKENIDLIIMGTHGRKGLERLIFGSVAEKVSKTTPIPIMLVNPHRTKT